MALLPEVVETLEVVETWDGWMAEMIGKIAHKTANGSDKVYFSLFFLFLFAFLPSNPDFHKSLSPAKICCPHFFHSSATFSLLQQNPRCCFSLCSDARDPESIVFSSPNPARDETRRLVEVAGAFLSQSKAACSINRESVLHLLHSPPNKQIWKGKKKKRFRVNKQNSVQNFLTFFLANIPAAQCPNWHAHIHWLEWVRSRVGRLHRWVFFSRRKVLYGKFVLKIRKTLGKLSFSRFENRGPWKIYNKEKMAQKMA